MRLRYITSCVVIRTAGKSILTAGMSGRKNCLIPRIMKPLLSRFKMRESIKTLRKELVNHIMLKLKNCLLTAMKQQLLLLSKQ